MNYIKTCITIILLSSTVFALSQEKTRKRTRIGFHFAPSYTYRILSSKSQEEIYHYSYMRYRDVTESASKSKAEYNRKIPFDFKLGVSVDYSLSNNTSLESGILYDVYSYERYVSGVWKYDASHDKNELYHFEYSFISVPIVFNYKIEKRRLIYSGGIGLMQSFLIDKNEDIEEAHIWGEVISSETNIYNVGPLIKLGLDYKISKSISIFCEPQFSIMLTPFKTDDVISSYTEINNILTDGIEAQIKERLYSISLSIGVRI